MSQHLDKLEVGQPMHFKHIAGNVKLQYPFNKKGIGMIVGGTGITPMIQALHCVLGTKDDTSKVSMLYGSKSSKDILAKEPAEGSSWTGARGFITKDMIEASFPKPDTDCL